MLQLCRITDALLIANARSACSDELIRREGVTLCINVSRQQPFPSARVGTLRVPVYDDPAENLYRYFDRCADAIQGEAGRGGSTVVYCKNGRSRSAAVCAAYLMKHRALPLTDAFQMVKTARSVVDPNPGFWEQLEKYEQELERRRAEGNGRLTPPPR
ncbi:dual specificity phosphatase 28 [Anguilla anguilla]|uniref:dual specificity phosphatase 28 n=1 Tax=Anguilla anguilla TaxID=7936 RepID=UPI0015AF9E36|nr:dual specificity phosphatase 28 [Anguilla anguilla]XP_035276605.1 dual specificity phosphatase 28 [Anguilla anguilla]XP_035276606.1 dual specificity phosphatase 28 [Anguilla anguilla]